MTILEQFPSNVRAAQGAGSRLYFASVLEQGREDMNIRGSNPAAIYKGAANLRATGTTA